MPNEYTLGTGHIKFMVPRLKFLADRYESLVTEMQGSFGSYEPHSQRRGYKPNPIDRKDLLDKIDARLYNDYTPTAEAVRINRDRIELRLKGE